MRPTKPSNTDVDAARPRRFAKPLQILVCVAAMGVGAMVAEQVSFVRVIPASSTAHAAVITRAEPIVRPLRVETQQIVDMAFSADEVRTADAVGSSLANGKVITGSTRNRLILFTFDDGPDRRTTPRLLRHLDDAGLRAVFFVTTNKIHGPGDRIRAQAELLRDIVRRGHMVGNHTHQHTALPLADTPTVIEEIETAQNAMEDVLGVRPWLFRPPGGTRSPRIDRLLADRGYTQVLWNLGTGDFQVRTAEEVLRIWTRTLARRERENEERGGIVLLHDTHPWSIEAFPMIVAEIERRNCELLQQGEELFDIIEDPAMFFQQRGEDPSETQALLDLPQDQLAIRQARARAHAEQRCN